FTAPARIRPIQVADEVSTIDSTQEGIPHMGAYRLDIDIDVIIGTLWLAAEDARRCCVPQVVAASYDGITSGVVLAHCDPAVVHHRILHRDLDLLALPSCLPLPERCQDAHYGVDTGTGVADGG